MGGPRRLKLLLDTHALLWWALDDAALTRTAREAIASADVVHVSPVSGYEILIKFATGRLPGADALARDFAGQVRNRGLIPLVVTIEHAARAGALSLDHRDPFDRLLIGQALESSLTLVSNERLFDSFGVNRLW